MPGNINSLNLHGARELFLISCASQEAVNPDWWLIYVHPTKYLFIERVK